jgi:adenosylhomocysteine nucleosidase
MGVSRHEVVAVVGMTREAKILAGARVVVGGGDEAALAARLETELSGGAAGVVSFGLCGALDPELKVGDLVLGDSVGDGEALYRTDPFWIERLKEALPHGRLGALARAERLVASVAAKSQLRSVTGAAAVDLESFAAARLAKWFGLPFAIIRAVSDAAGRALPPAAQVGLGRDGRPAIGPVFASLRANPWQIAALVRTALEAEDGFHALERARHLLGPRLGGPDLG